MKNETLGQVFKRYRQAEKLKIATVEKDLKISQRMIAALEEDDYRLLPDEVYTKNIIKAYAQYLSLDYNKLLVLYEDGKQANTLPVKAKNSRQSRVYLTPQRVRNLLIVTVIIVLIGYLGWQVNKIFIPPRITVYQPASNIKIQDNFIEIKGSADKEARVFINDKEIFLDQQGEFATTLDLQNGINYIKISAIKKHSRENAVYREILVE